MRVLGEKGQISGAAADVFKKIEQAQQGCGRVGLPGGGLCQTGYHGIEARLGVGGKVAVFMAVADLLEPCGDGIGIKTVLLQTACTLIFIRFTQPKPLPFVLGIVLRFFRFAEDFVEQGVDLGAVGLQAV